MYKIIPITMFNLIYSYKQKILNFIFILQKIKYYLNQKTIYQMYEESEKINSFNKFHNNFKTSIFLETSKDVRLFSIKRSIENDQANDLYYLEFGVYKGTSINLFSKFVKTIYGFDSFEGLREDWEGYLHPKGYFSLNSKIPKLKNNAIAVPGWVQDTLPKFLKEHDPKINFVHMDLDTYDSSKYVLSKIKPYLVENAVILFDELYNFPGWEVGEYKALTEVFNEDEYKFLAFAKSEKNAAIKIIKKSN